jgi:hypothetical protein
MRTRLLLTAGTGLFVTTLVLQAQQQPPATLVPLTAASLATQTERYLGQTVAVYGAVDGQISQTIFSLDQDATRPAVNDIIVIAPTLQTPAPAGAYVTVIGEAMRFDEAVLTAKAKQYKLDIPADAAARFKGRPMVLATQVVDAANTDLAKAPPVPLTPEEEAFDKVMKQVNPTFGEIRKGLEAADLDLITTQGTKLRGLFAETRTFFNDRSTLDAVGWAGEAVSAIDDMLRSAKANDWPAAKEAGSKIQPLCAACHSEHRERDAEGNYRVKKN